jgi:hypothetical protein
MNVDDALKVADAPVQYTKAERQQAYETLHKAAWESGSGDLGFMYQDKASEIWVFATDQGDVG